MAKHTHTQKLEMKIEKQTRIKKWIDENGTEPIKHNQQAIVAITTYYGGSSDNCYYYRHSIGHDTMLVWIRIFTVPE